MTEIYFIRHAESFYSKEDNDFDRPLTVRGKVDAEELAKYFSDISIDHIISSPYVRAIDTVEIIARDKGLPLELVNDFRERRVGDKDVAVGEFENFAQKQWNDFHYARRGGESLYTVQKRALKSLEKVLQKYSDNNIIIATHGTLLGIVLNYYDDEKYDFQYWKGLKMPDIFSFKFNSKTLDSIERCQL